MSVYYYVLPVNIRPYSCCHLSALRIASSFSLFNISIWLYVGGLITRNNQSHHNSFSVRPICRRHRQLPLVTLVFVSHLIRIHSLFAYILIPLYKFSHSITILSNQFLIKIIKQGGTDRIKLIKLFKVMWMSSTSRPVYIGTMGKDTATGWE